MNVPGTLVVAPTRGYSTFEPEPLPPQAPFTRDVLELAERATHVLGKVEMCQSLLPNVDILIFSSLRKEAIASSTIEGTVASPDQLALFQLANVESNSSVREVSNYVLALQVGIEQIRKRPITSNLILGLHAVLMRDVRGQINAGRFKSSQNYIARAHGDPISEAIFVPASPHTTAKHMNSLEKYINLPQDQPRVLQCALAHYQFETIHPFGDGNGRIGRLLIVLHLIQLGLLSEPLIYPSVYFERTREEYYGALQAVRTEGNWNRWCKYFLEAIEAQAGKTITLVHEFLRLQRELSTKALSVRKQASVQRVLEAFFKEPYLTLPGIASETGLSFNAAQSATKSLLDMGILWELFPERKRNRIYGCKPIADVIFVP